MLKSKDFRYKLRLQII